MKKTNVVYIVGIICGLILTACISRAEMVAAWDFESGVADVWTNNLGGTAVNGATTIADAARYGNVLVLSNVSSQYVTIADNNALDLTATATVAAWIYAEDGPDCVLSKGTWDTAYTIRLDSGGSLNKINFHGNTVISANAVTVGGQWVHIAVTHDSAAVGQETRFYINGILDSVSADAGDLASNTDPMEIGHAKAADPWGYWNGRLDDVALWNNSLNAGNIRALYNLSANADLHLSSSEVQQLFSAYENGAGTSTNIGGIVWVYKTGLNATYDGKLVKDGIYYALVMDATAGTGMSTYVAPSLAGVWDFESGVTDVGANNLGGTAVNGATTTADAARYGNVLVLDSGSSQSVQVADDDLLDFTKTATVMFWAYAVDGGPDAPIAKGVWDAAYSIRLDDSPKNIISFHGQTVNSSNAVSNNEWVHITITHNADAIGTETRIYTNGVLDATQADAGSLVVNSDMLEFGHAKDAAWSYWNGRLDDIALWNASLSEGEVRALYNLGANADLHYNPVEVQQLLGVYEGGAGSSATVGNQRWVYATGLTATEDGQLNVPGTKGTYEIVMDATRGTGIVIPHQGTLILIN